MKKGKNDKGKKSMQEKQPNQQIKNAVIILFLLTAAAVIYLPGLKNIGYFRDDWNNVYNAFTQGADMLIKHYSSDRPADGYLLSWVYTLFGPDPYPYLLINLACRFFCALFFFRHNHHNLAPAKDGCFLCRCFLPDFSRIFKAG